MSPRRLALLAALLVAVAVGSWTLDGAPRPFAGSEQSRHADALTASPHAELGVVARTLRTPLPSVSVGIACGILAALAVALSASRRAPVSYRHTPLYTLLRVYRL